MYIILAVKMAGSILIHLILLIFLHDEITFPISGMALQ